MLKKVLLFLGVLVLVLFSSADLLGKVAQEPEGILFLCVLLPTFAMAVAWWIRKLDP